MTTKVTRQYPDGTLETTTEDTRTLEEKLNGKLTFKEKLDILYPTSNNTNTEGWREYDEHKLFK